MRKPRAPVASLFAVVSLLATAAAQDPPSILTGVEKTAHFEIRFRPGSRAEASVDRVAALVEDDLRRILQELAVDKFPFTIRLFLYDDVAELQKITGVPASGYSVPLQSHVPHDNDQTRVHELVHVAAERFTEKGNEPRNLFFAEGLANAVLRFVHGVSVDAVAAFYRQRGELPTIAEIQAIPDFYQWLAARPNFNAYDVAGSYMRYLLDAHGAAKVRKYYKGVPAKAAFGVETTELEKGWHARLDAVTLRPGTRALLTERAGGAAAHEKNAAEAKLDDAILGPRAEWKSLAGARLRAGAEGQWSGDELVLTGKGDESLGGWCLVSLGADAGDAMVRGVAEPQSGCFGVQIQLGQKCQAIVLQGQGTFIYTDQGGVAHAPAVQLGGRAVEIVLRRRGKRASAWVDGRLIVEADVEAVSAPVSVGCIGGKARFSKLAVRRLK